MSYPVQWLDQTFKSRAKAEELLRPDLESGIITQHDFSLAVEFLPGFHRYWPYAFGAGATATTAAYGRLFKYPKWGVGRILALSSTAYFFGTVYGQFRRARAHLSFTRQLENPVGFSQALQNVNKRIGGETPLRWSISAANQPQPTSDVHGDSRNPEEPTWATETSTQAAQSPNTPAPQPTAQPKSRWEEIREANTRSAKTSSWDVLRQGHERAQATDNLQPVVAVPNSSTTHQDRAQEQAQFDAMLEAERRIARG